MNNESRGKRRFAVAMMSFQLAVSVLGAWNPYFWSVAQFYAPFLIPASITLFLGDAVSDTWIKSVSIRESKDVR